MPNSLSSRRDKADAQAVATKVDVSLPLPRIGLVRHDG
jgi:hypothetical protein